MTQDIKNKILETFLSTYRREHGTSEDLIPNQIDKSSETDSIHIGGTLDHTNQETVEDCDNDHAFVTQLQTNGRLKGKYSR